MLLFRKYLSCEQVLALAEVSSPAHIIPIHDPKFVPQYRIRREVHHDGTFVFSKELMQTAISNLLDKTSYYVPMGSPGVGVIDIRYFIGKTRWIKTVGMVKLPCGYIQGVKERVVIPVRCEYVY